MTPDLWQQIEAAFNQAADLPPDAQQQYLNQLDPDIRAEVESLLKAEHNPLTLTTEIATNIAELQLNDPRNNQRLGPYRILGELGTGGMGSVFKATRDDDAYQKVVAIKIIRANLAHTQLEARFRAERQILAQLEHPYIARLIDGGTHDNLPYIVMEFIEGQPIDQYVKQNKLSTKDRLILFRKVCEAVQHAHARLIVHRDLKPGNILVLPDGTPKLLDFGIAKLLDQETPEGPLTQTGWLLMTPDYASPEQVRGETITVASDVYSLAVILYELLTGERPYKLKNYSPSEIQDLVCSQAVQAPSSRVTRASKLRRQLEGDLDNVILMALRKEPERRYQSVEQFSEDLRRHLIGETVSARPDTFIYRSSKFVKRNSLAVALAAILLISILTGAALVYREGLRAQRRFTQVRAIANRVLTEFDPEASKLPNSTKLRASMVRASMEYLDSLAAETTSDPDLQYEVAFSYSRVGDTLGYPRDANLNQPFEAAIAYNKAIDLCKNLSTQKSRELLAYLYAHYAALVPRLGKSDQTNLYFEKALTLLNDASPTTIYEVRHGYAHQLAMQGDLDRAIKLLTPILNSPNPQIAMQANHLASQIEASRGNLVQAISHAENGIAISNRVGRTPLAFERLAATLLLDRARLAYSDNGPSQWRPCDARTYLSDSASIALKLATLETFKSLSAIHAIDILQLLATSQTACDPQAPSQTVDQLRTLYARLNLIPDLADSIAANTLFQQNKPDQALTLITPHLKQSKQQFDILLIAAQIYLALHRPIQAIETLEPTLKLLITDGQRKSLDAILSRERTLPAALFLGDAYQQLNKTNEAKATWRTALDLAPKVSAPYPPAPSTLHWRNQIQSRLN
jgi:serine/threonine protein kinase